MLASVVIVNLIRRGAPIFFAPWPFVADLRNGAITGGTGEAAILGAAMAQIGNHYGLPTSQGSCMTDAKVPDAQSGFEKASMGILAAQAGSNRVQSCAGTLAAIKTCAHEALIIDNDMLGIALRSIRGIEVSEETMAVETIRECALNPGHYLGHPSTLSRMETDFEYPKLSDRDTPDLWEERGGRDAYDLAKVKAADILANHFPNHIDPDLDARIRAKWDIRIPEERMRAVR